MALTAQQRLTEAEAALHALALGKSVVEITDASGDKVRYGPANMSRLREYIADLKSEVAGVSRVSPPLRPVFY
jgi:hypothetical protein